MKKIIAIFSIFIASNLFSYKIRIFNQTNNDIQGTVHVACIDEDQDFTVPKNDFTTIETSACCITYVDYKRVGSRESKYTVRLPSTGFGLSCKSSDLFIKAAADQTLYAEYN